MKHKHRNRLTAAKTTVDFCEKTSSATSSIPNFAPKVGFIKSEIAVIEGFIQLSDQPTKGVRLDVEGIRANMIEKTLPLGNAVTAYAACLEPMDHDLMAQAKLTKTFLEDTSKERCGNECKRVVDLAGVNAANILPMGISGTDIADAQSTVSLFMNVINDPRAAIITRAGAGEQAMQRLTKLMNVYLDLQLDSMANTLRFRNPAWWREYHMNRHIIQLGRTYTKVRAEVKDADDKAVKGATLLLIQNGVVVYSKKTNVEGKVSIAKIKPGNYDLRIEKAGFVPYSEEDFHVAAGSEKIHHVVLVAG
jgi:hypothetical protein